MTLMIWNYDSFLEEGVEIKINKTTKNVTTDPLLLK